MASKEYSMLFKLQARLGSEFNTTFSSAQHALQEVQQQMIALHRQQTDISAYEKQQKSIESTSRKLELLQKEYDNIQREIQETEGFSSSLENKLIRKQQAIDSTSKALRTQTENLQRQQEALRESGIDTDRLTDESRRLSSEFEALAKQEQEATAQADNYKDVGVSTFEAVGSALVAAGIAEGLKAVARAYAECVQIAGDFQSTMSTVEALSGSNTEEMAALTQQAKDLGAITQYTAKQSAEAMTFMGMAGWDATQMMSGMDGVLQLAAASGEDLALTSDIVTDNLTAFRLKAEDTAHFADVLAAAATKSNTSVSIMGETFKSSASVAGALGYKIEDVSIAVGLMANSGVKGSIAGTALRNTFNGILNGATLTSKAFGEVEISALRSDGTLKTFSETVDELRGYFGQMTEAERVMNAQAVAGERGYNGLLAIVNSTKEDYDKLTESINNCSGAAGRMAEIRMDNLNGQVTLMNSAMDALKTTIGEAFQEELRGLSAIATDILTNVNDFLSQNPAVLKALMLVTAEIGLVVAGYYALTTVKKIKNTLDELGAALSVRKAAATAAAAAAQGAEATATTGAAAAQTGLNTAMLASPIFVITAAVVALTAGLTILREVCKEQAFETQTISSATERECNEVTKLNAQYEEACQNYGQTSRQARSLKYDLDAATAAINDQSFSVKELYADIDALHSSTGDLLEDCRNSTAEIDEQYESAMILSSKLHDLAESSDQSATAQAKMEPIVNRLNEIYPSLGLTIENVSDKMGDLNGQIEQAAKSQSLQAKYESAKENLSELYVKQQQLQEAAEKAEVAQLKAGQAYSKAVGNDFFSVAGGMLTGRISDTEKSYNEALEKMYTAREDLAAVEAQIRECEAAMEEYGGVVTGTSAETVSAYDAVSIAVSGVTAETEELLKAYNDAYQAAYNSISGQYALWDEAAEVSEMNVSVINQNLEDQAAYWDNYNANINSLLGRTDDIAGLKDIISSFADGSSDSVNMIAGMASASDEELQKMVENWQKVQEEQEKTAAALADTKVDFKEQLDGISKDMTETVQGMNLSDEAKVAAEETMKAYADAIIASKGSVEEAATLVKAAVDGALSQAYNGTPAGDSKIGAYASGTDNALPGLALVGENGPELVSFGGGERVFTAQETEAMMSEPAKLGDGGMQTVTITIAPTFHVEASQNGDLEETLRGFGDEIVVMVMDALEEANINTRRSVYK